METGIKQRILDARQEYVEQLISIATNPTTPAGQAVAAARLLEKTLKDMNEQEALQQDERGEGSEMLVINI